MTATGITGATGNGNCVGNSAGVGDEVGKNVPIQRGAYVGNSVGGIVVTVAICNIRRREGLLEGDPVK